ncbi:pectate lyase family protein [Flavobacterium capsici]|uniref:T9SS type A sorting domain-containing protein n=1 Tax=Flavobacterium capsici TaxID=3075618 RepID=A0AA96ET94_9FLAO|nr:MULTISPECIES: T9SS type A sorting domain-containing protein [unclassified Flavobacterium]WNM17754.1 T9SS type A sorting domain-containing protein [Flavobacterium sp. PMR2A8]WNM21807.1 T9SS type A sorting domain-containing protein [Flavobacterium sp. PMTSA4]
MKRILFYVTIMFASINLWAQPVIIQSSGWMECAYVKWEPVAGADSYNVYYTGGTFTNQIIDTQLIRNYGSYYRADVLGLAPGTYTIKVVPVTGGVEGTPSVSNNITVSAHDRNGFAFEGGRIPGAYNLNGTLKANAVVLYITQNNKNTVSMNVTGATVNPCVGLQTILDGFKKGLDTRPLSVRLIGNITDLNYMLNGDIVIENKNNINSSITFEGVGSDALVNGWGVRVKKGSNIEIRNLGFMLTNASEGDNVGLQQDNDHIWVHNCDMFYGAAGGDADQAKGDGALDCKRSTYVTMSYNHFWDTGKSNLLGLSESGPGLYATYHHNWYDHSDSRHPRVRTYSAHVYNNYFDGNSKYGAGSTMASSLFLEGNYFRNCKYPMLISQQGTDIYNGSVGTFSGEEGGIIKAFNNVMSGQTRYVPYDATNYPVQFDAYEVTTRSQTVPSSITALLGGTSYNNFDTNPTLYVNSLVVDDPTVAKDKVIAFSGRVGGGDISWTFNNAVDDPSSTVNTGLAALLNNYSSGIVSIQGDAPSTTSSQTLIIPNNNDQTVLSGAMTDMVFTWGGTATDVTVTGLPSNGIDFVKDMTARTVTVSGTPTGDVTFTVTTSGPTGTPVSGSGTIATTNVPNGDEIHNFTLQTLNSTFYTFTSCNMNSTAGSTTYDGLTLTARMKVESATNVSYTTPDVSTLTLVFDPTFSGTIKLDNVSYTASNGVVIIPSVPAGAHAITKGSVANLFYIKTEYTALGVGEINNSPKLTLYPNPVTNELNITTSNSSSIEKVAVYNLLGQLVKNANGDIRTIDMSDLNTGTYFVKVYTNQGIIDRKIIKR